MELESPSLLLLAVPSITLILGLLGIMLLLIGSALVSGSEVAFFSLSPNDLEKLSQEQSTSSTRVLQLKEYPRKLLATILITNNFINILIVIISDLVLRELLPERTFEAWANQFLHLFPQAYRLNTDFLTNAISISITVIGVTFLLVLFGEVAPKVYANLNNIQLARFTSLPLSLLMVFFSPISNGLVKWTNRIERRLAKSTRNGNITSREDIDEAIELTVNDEEDVGQQADILKRIVKFGDVSVTQIMRSRVDVVAIDFRIGFKELLKVARESGYSRIPVYDEEFDNVTGILYVKDLLGHLNEPDKFEWQGLIRTNVMYVPEAKKIDDLLKEFQLQRTHMAIVVDEYGGSSGIVTLEDIMEEIIGDIKDEFDNEIEVIYKKIDDFNYLFEGKTLLNDVCKVMDLDSSTFDDIKGEADTIAGLILEALGEFPKAELELAYNQFKFKVVSVSERRIEQILVTIRK